VAAGKYGVERRRILMFGVWKVMVEKGGVVLRVVEAVLCF